MAKAKPPQPRTVNRWDEFGNEVRRLRKEEGLSQTELAAKIDVSQPLISLVESGSPVSPRNVQRIGGWLGIDTSALRQSLESVQEVRWSYCGDTRCASLRLAANEGQLCIAPKFERFATVRFETCGYCKQPFIQECSECGKAIRKRRLVCGDCGHRYVEVPASLVGLSAKELEREADAWDDRNRRIREWIDNQQ